MRLKSLGSASPGTLRSRSLACRLPSSHHLALGQLAHSGSSSRPLNSGLCFHSDHHMAWPTRQVTTGECGCRAQDCQVQRKTEKQSQLPGQVGTPVPHSPFTSPPCWLQEPGQEFAPSPRILRNGKGNPGPPHWSPFSSQPRLNPQPRPPGVLAQSGRQAPQRLGPGSPSQTSASPVLSKCPHATKQRQTLNPKCPSPQPKVTQSRTRANQSLPR